MDNVFRANPSSRLRSSAFVNSDSSCVGSTIAAEFFETESISYFGILKRYTGAAWVKAKLKVYTGGSFQSKPLKVYVNSAWGLVDTSG